MSPSEMQPQDWFKLKHDIRFSQSNRLSSNIANFHAHVNSVMDRGLARRRRLLATANSRAGWRQDVMTEEDSVADRAAVAESSRWKQERLAERHSYFVRLDRAFVTWRNLANAQRQRRQRVIAACRVGARFFQRLYWSEWKAYVANRKLRRSIASEKIQRVNERVTVQRVLSIWREHVKRQRVRSLINVQTTAQQAIDEHHLEVRGVHVAGVAVRAEATASIRGSTRRRVVQSTTHSHDKRNNALRHIVVRYTQRHYFQYWQAFAAMTSRVLMTQLYASANRFRTQQSLARWRRGFLRRTEQHQAARRAVFFLYYSLTKSSLDRLRKFALSRRRERGVSVILSTRIRRHRLRAAFKMWRQRLNVKLVFSEWRLVAMGRDHDQQTDTIAHAIRDLSRRRVLHQVFASWLHQSVSRKRGRSIQRVLHGPIYKLVIASAFRSWRQQAHQQTAINQWMRKRNNRRLRFVWEAWSQLAREKEKQRRYQQTARRFWYYSTLHKAFDALKGLPQQRITRQVTINQLQQRHGNEQLRRVFRAWQQWTQARRHQQANWTQAVWHRDITLKKSVVNKLRDAVLQSRQFTEAAHTQAKRSQLRALNRIFTVWRAHANTETRRTQSLALRLTKYRTRRAHHSKSQAFHSLVEYTRQQISKRLVIAHARGHYQSRLLRRSIAQWLVAVTALKWQHIFESRARQFHRAHLQRRFFALWKMKAMRLRRHRAKTIRALHHWKKARERQAFTAWKAYIAGKRGQRERMHAALEYRHAAYVRDGLTQWIVGAAYLAEQRTKRTIAQQATHRERVWRRVRAIATHWRFLTVKRREMKTGGLPSPSLRPPLLFEDGAIDLRSQRDRHRLPPTQPPRNRSSPPSSSLSEFVLLPRNRPRPRKPIELIVDSDAVTVDSVGADTIKQLNHRYGFQFPSLHVERVDLSTSDRHVVADPVEDGGHYWSMEALEKRLAFWQDRRQRLQKLQQSLVDFRELLLPATTQGNLSLQELDRIETRVQTMEQQEAAARQQWAAARPEIQRIACQLKILRSTASPA